MKSEGRYIALDVGRKRTGLAVTDSWQMIASPVEGVLTHELKPRLQQLVNEESCAGLVVGDPKQFDGRPSEIADFINETVAHLKKSFPELNIYREDERFSSRMASQALAMGGVPKKKRQEKLRIDSTSAAIILQSFLERRKK